MRLDCLILNQLKLASKIKLKTIADEIHSIAGVDVAVAGNKLVGCISVLTYPEFKYIEHECAVEDMSMPYIPNFLSFREIPVLLKCYKRLTKKPDLMLVDGQGIAHPRAVGLASHLGVILNKPTIGCAKSHLFGTYRMPGVNKGAYSMLRNGEREIGLVMRTRDYTNPIYVSPGHLVDLCNCRTFVLASAIKYRIPEPIRYAHKTAGNIARRIHE